MGRWNDFSPLLLLETAKQQGGTLKVLNACRLLRMDIVYVICTKYPSIRYMLLPFDENFNILKILREQAEVCGVRKLFLLAWTKILRSQGKKVGANELSNKSRQAMVSVCHGRFWIIRVWKSDNQDTNLVWPVKLFLAFMNVPSYLYHSWLFLICDVMNFPHIRRTFILSFIKIMF